MKKYKINFYELSLIFGAIILNAIAQKYFIIPLGLNLSGVMGLSVLGTKLKGLAISSTFDYKFFALIYIILNVPLIIFAFFKLGKKLVLYTLIIILSIPTILNILPNVELIDINSNKLTTLIAGAFISGSGCALAYKGNGTMGGLDVITVYITKIKKQVSIANLTFAHTTILFIIAQVLYKQKFGTQLIDERLIYSVIFIWMSTLTINFFYPRHKIIRCTIVTKDNKRLEELIKENFSHKSFSTYDVIGKNGDKSTAIEIVMSFYESKDLIRLLKTHDIDNFFYTSYVFRAHKNFASIK